MTTTVFKPTAEQLTKRLGAMGLEGEIQTADGAAVLFNTRIEADAIRVNAPPGEFWYVYQSHVLVRAGRARTWVASCTNPEEPPRIALRPEEP